MATVTRKTVMKQLTHKFDNNKEGIVGLLYSTVIVTVNVCSLNTTVYKFVARVLCFQLKGLLHLVTKTKE